MKQIFIWLKNPDFQHELRYNQNLIFADSICSLKGVTQKAVQALISCLIDQDPRIRLSAAEKIISNAYKGMELYELEERLQEVEKRIERVKGNESSLP